MVGFCREHGIAHQTCGKIIVARTEDETRGSRSCSNVDKETGSPA
jgi:L-2-hydroxyglutarate oxidase LhgO